jgi:hypothetical protein
LLAGQPDYVIVVDDNNHVVLGGIWHGSNPETSRNYPYY